MKTKLSRPHEMRILKLSAHDYKLIGEIAVLSGMLEMELKQTIVKMVDAPWPDGLALVIHQNFGSLCDIAETLIPSTIVSVHFRLHFKKAIEECRAAYDSRNTLLHGPFSPTLKTVTGTTGMFKITARSKMNFKVKPVTTASLSKQLKDLIDAYDFLWWCQLTLGEERDGLLLQHGPIRSHKAVQIAKSRKS